MPLIDYRDTPGIIARSAADVTLLNQVLPVDTAGGFSWGRLSLSPLHLQLLHISGSLEPMQTAPSSWGVHMKCAKKAYQALPGLNRVHFAHMQAHWCILSCALARSALPGLILSLLFSTSHGSEANKGWEAAALPPTIPSRASAAVGDEQLWHCSPRGAAAGATHWLPSQLVEANSG